MENKSDFLICDTTQKDDARLKQIGMSCFNTNIDAQHQLWLVRILFTHYFSKRKFKKRRQAEVVIRALLEEDEIVGFYELEKTGLLSSLYVIPEKQKKDMVKHLWKMP